MVCGGVIPLRDAEELRRAGVAAVFGPGANILDAAAKVLDILGGAAHADGDGAHA